MKGNAKPYSLTLLTRACRQHCTSFVTGVRQKMDFAECMVLVHSTGSCTFPTVDKAMAMPCVHVTQTVTEKYVTDAVETLDILDVEVVDLQPLLEELARLRTAVPVTAGAIDRALKGVAGAHRAAYKRVQSFIPRCLKTLNGEGYALVPPDILHRAADREHAMAGMVHGWGVCDPPPHAIAHRLLCSCGLDPRHLPAYKTVPPTQRGRLMCAWAGACAQLGWAHYDPKPDVDASQRACKQLDAFIKTQTHKEGAVYDATAAAYERR
jgi:hypothetical protein